MRLLNTSKKTPKQIINLTIGRLFGVEIELRKHFPTNNKASDVLKPLFSDIQWTNALKLEHGIYEPESGELFIFHDTGLFSCLSVTLWCLCDLISAGYVPKKVNFSGTLTAYKDAPGLDVYPELFETVLSESVRKEILQLSKGRSQRFNHHGNYKTLDCEWLSLLARTYLNINSSVNEHTQLLRTRNIVPGKRYVGVWYRGTDKSIEVMPTDSSFYIEATERLLEKRLVDRILIQTDQAQVCDLFKRYFGDICDFIDELPRTEGSTAFHRSDEINGQRADHATNMLAAVSIIASMPYVISYTGNIGAWIVLMRGSSQNVWQATPDGIVEQ